jgi:protein-S-isoprenylcysteine O-methyltransferase Ste14
MAAEALLVASLMLVLSALFALLRNGARSRKRADGSLFEFEKTTWLVTNGVYHYIRHPMYASLLTLNWGCFFQAPSWSKIGLASVATLFLALTTRADEQECLRYFGSLYADYMQATKRFIPLLF